MVEDGVAEIDAPVPTGVPPHDVEYQCHVAPADNVPATCKPELTPEHIGEVPLAAEGSRGGVITATLVFTQPE